MGFIYNIMKPSLIRHTRLLQYKTQDRQFCCMAVTLKGDCKPYPHNVNLVNIYEHFSQKLLDLDM